jgi:hypothetical protein
VEVELQLRAGCSACNCLDLRLHRLFWSLLQRADSILPWPPWVAIDPHSVLLMRTCPGALSLAPCQPWPLVPRVCHPCEALLQTHAQARDIGPVRVC